MEYDFEKFSEQHRMQLVMSGIPSQFWPKLHEKLGSEVFDAGNYFSMIFQNDEDEDKKVENGRKESVTSDNGLAQGDSVRKNSSYCGSISGSGCQSSKWKVVVSNQDGVSISDPSQIFLIDHAWTFKPHEARRHLEQVPGLADRMSKLVVSNSDLDDVDVSSSATNTSNEVVEQVLNQIYRYSQTYTVNKDDMDLEEKLSVWYVLDEFGSRVRHNDEPSFRIVPFFYIPQQILYSLLFPLKNVAFGEEVTRDFVEGTLYHRPEWRELYLLPWFSRIFSHVPIEFAQPDEEYFQAYEPLPARSLPVAQNQQNGDSGCKVLKVYAENNQIVAHLTSPRFELTDSMDEADIWWLQSHFREYSMLITDKPRVLVNQFPCESVLTVKDLLAACIHLVYADKEMDEKTLEFQPAWFCTTFNLRTELPQFVSYFQRREEMDFDNTWIVKPWNLARSLDTFVTNDLGQIIRMIDSGPKIACKYVEDPVLFYRSDIDAWVKFDLRFIVFLTSVKPLKCFVYNKFWLRFALKSFSLDRFDDFEKHFTVFNYLDKDKILQMTCDDFVKDFERQYPSEEWSKIQESINASMKHVFEIGTHFPPPRGIAPVAQCRAMYGIDVMLKWSTMPNGQKFIQPVILEVNFMPDCIRACSYYENFANTVFETMFLDDSPALINNSVSVL